MAADAAVAASVRQAPRVCFFAHYHPTGVVADYVLHYLAELRKAGFATVVASTAALGEGEVAKLREACDDLILRENRGLDFGGWIDCWRKWAPLDAELLLLANDSVYGPIGDLGACIDQLCATPADFYGLVGSAQLGHHLQSWFVMLRPSAYRSDAFGRLLSRPIADGLTKDEIIGRYETALTSALEREGLVGHALYDPARDGLLSRRMPFNATHFLWQELVVELGIPFIKIDLLRDNSLFVDDLGRWGGVVAERTPDLVAAIAADLAARRGAQRAPPKSPGGAGPALLVFYLRWFRRCAVRDFRYRRARRPAALWLNAAYFAAGRLAYRVTLKVGTVLGKAAAPQ